MAFKGGTALSKCWKAIDRFSEDIDLSIHWSDLAGAEDEAALWEKSTSTRTQRDKFRDNQNKKLLDWSRELVGTLNTRFEEYDIPELQAELQNETSGEKIEIKYPRVTTTDSEYHLDYVLLEFGGRNRGLPSSDIQVTSYMSDVPDFGAIEFPIASVKVFDIAYMVWEKLTALHQFSTQTKEPRAHRLARHWYDVDRLLAKNLVDPLKELDAMIDVIQMKYFRWNMPGVDYTAVPKGGLKLIPEAVRKATIEKDHEESIKGRMFHTDPDAFSDIIDRLQVVETRINEALTNPAQFIRWATSGAWKQAVLEWRGNTFRSKMVLKHQENQAVKDINDQVTRELNSIICRSSNLI